MLTIFTTTYCRPDYVQLLADALRVTTQEQYRFVVYVQPNGLIRDWKYVDEIIYQKQSGYLAWREIIIPSSPSLILHDDCVPVKKWSSLSFPMPRCSRAGGYTLQYSADGSQQYVPMLRAKRVNQSKICDYDWSDELCNGAVDADVESLLNGIFLHIDKGTIGAINCGANLAKPALIKAICSTLNIEEPEPLSEKELSIHPGKMIPAPIKNTVCNDKKRVNYNYVSINKITNGPGTILKQLLADWLGIIAEGGCKCNSMAEKMNRMGPDWCEGQDGMGEILRVMKTEHTKRYNKKETRIPWTDTGAKTLIKIACYRARNN